MAEAGLLWLTQKKNNKIKHIEGNYRLHITLNPPHKRRIDLGNFEKVVSDLLQHLGIIEDDRFCRELLMDYGEAPLGTRIILTHHH